MTAIEQKINDTHAQALGEVYKECQRHLEKWGVQNHDPLYWIGVLGEEFGEVCQGAIEFDESSYRRELIQVAAVAVSAIECLDRIGADWAYANFEDGRESCADVE